MTIHYSPGELLARALDRIGDAKAAPFGSPHAVAAYAEAQALAAVASAQALTSAAETLVEVLGQLDDLTDLVERGVLFAASAGTRAEVAPMPSDGLPEDEAAEALVGQLFAEQAAAVAEFDGEYKPALDVFAQAKADAEAKSARKAAKR